jgi:diguanylate cyclase (GGDEF)-like protein
VQVTRAARTRTSLAIAMVDIDHFKAFNDTYGHLAGDAVLTGVPAALTGEMHEYDLADRFGGEEFSLLLSHADTKRLSALPNGCAASSPTSPSRPPARPGTNPPHITVSIGVAVLSQSISDLTDLLAVADTAPYRAKGAGRNAVRLADHPPPSQNQRPSAERK